MKFASGLGRLTIAALGLGMVAGCGESWSSAAGQGAAVRGAAVRGAAVERLPIDGAPVDDGLASSSSPAKPSADTSEPANAAETQTANSQLPDMQRKAVQRKAATGGETASSVSQSGPPQPPAAKPVVSTRIADISFDDIKFEMEKGAAFERSMLTPQIEALDGRKVRIRGFILPPPVASGLTRFVLVRDNLSCCFGPGAALYDAIFVEMVADKSTEYTISPVTVEGVFTVSELRDPDDNIMAIYHLDGESVR
jgi:hypothetical protein